MRPLPPPDLCGWCHPLDGRRPGCPLQAACVHEHVTTLVLCPAHAAQVHLTTVYCDACRQAGYPLVPVTPLFPAPAPEKIH